MSTFGDSKFQSVELWNFSCPFLRIKTLDPTWECGFKAFQWRLGQPNLTKMTLIPKITKWWRCFSSIVTHTFSLVKFKLNLIFSGRGIEYRQILSCCASCSFIRQHAVSQRPVGYVPGSGSLIVSKLGILFTFWFYLNRHTFLLLFTTTICNNGISTQTLYLSKNNQLQGCAFKILLR